MLPSCFFAERREVEGDGCIIMGGGCLLNLGPEGVRCGDVPGWLSVCLFSCDICVLKNAWYILLAIL